MRNGKGQGYKTSSGWLIVQAAGDGGQSQRFRDRSGEKWMDLEVMLIRLTGQMSRR